MKPRQIATMAQLSPSDFYPEVSSGLSLLIKHIEKLNDAAAVLEDRGHNRSALVLRSLAREEAGKFLVLIDAVRCDRANYKKEFGRQLKRFTKHVPRGVQAEVCEIRPASYGELVAYIDDLLLPEYYLDGPNDYDWIFRNPVQADREEAFYVDYVERDNGLREWIEPSDLVSGYASIAADVAAALTRLGATTPLGLETLATEWRDFVPRPGTPYSDLAGKVRETITVLKSRGLGNGDDHDEHMLVDLWPFPLWRAEIDEPKSINPQELRRLRAQYATRMHGH